MALFDRFTEKSFNVLRLAENETRRLGHKNVGTVQLLLGLIREETGVAAIVLGEAGVSLENARREVEKIKGPEAGSYREISYNQHTRKIFELSATEADILKDSEIDTQHLLLGLLKQSEGAAIKILQNLGVNPTQLRTQVFHRLVEQGHPTASEFLPVPTPTPVNPNRTNLNNAHLALIQKILKYPEGSEAEVVKNNPGIIDPELIESMASILEQQGDTRGAKILRGLIAPRTEKTVDDSEIPPANVSEYVQISTPPEVEVTESESIESSAPPENFEPISSVPELQVTESESIEISAPPENLEPVVDVPTPSSQELEKFLYQLLRVSLESKADEQVVDNFLKENLDKLSDRFPEVLQNWANTTLPRVGDAKKQELLKRITAISSLIRKFNGGVRATNLEIALTGYNIVASVLTQVEVSEDWAVIQYCLGLTYLERVVGEREDNLKQAIAYFNAALDFYTQEQFPDKRKIILESVKKAGTELRNLLEKEEIDQKYLDFLIELLQAIAESQSNPETVYPLLANNLDKLDDNFVKVLQIWAITNFSKVESDVAEDIAGSIAIFSSLIQEFPLGNKKANVEIALAACEVISTVFTRNSHPAKWAMAQTVLGNAYRERIKGDKAQNIESAIAASQLALEVYTKTDFPIYWAMAQTFLGNAYRERIKGDKAQNIESAIAAFKLALEVYTKTDFPIYWAMNQGNLGAAYIEKIKGNKAENIEFAISALKLALQVYTKTDFPIQWATIQANLGAVYRERIKGDKAENIESAITTSKLALEVYTKTDFPIYWAMNQSNLGAAYIERVKGNKAENIEFAISALKLALQVRTPANLPIHWAETQINLGNAYRERIQGNKAENIESAIAAYQLALQVYTKTDFPIQWAAAQNNLGFVYRERIKGNKAENIESAISALKLALQVRTPTDLPIYWASDHLHYCGNMSLTTRFS